MKKVLSIVLVLLILLSLIGCSSKEKIPSFDEVSQLKYRELNEALSGKDIEKIRNVWGKPAERDGNEDIWQIDESMLLMITYNDTGMVENCELVCGTPLASQE